MIQIKDTRLPSVRLSTAELDRLLKAAELEEVRPSDFIRKALAEKVDKLSRRHPELQRAA
jgi:hypothetical protein